MDRFDIDNSVLYYPTIEFQDETWLKCALCIWDTVVRIVPPGYLPRDSEEVSQAVEAGAIDNLRLTKEDLAQTADRFEQFWHAVPFIPAGAEGPDDYDVRLHRDKIDARIQPILETLSTRIDTDGWLRLNSRLADSYMLFLSEEVSRRRAIPKLTDSSDMFAVIHYFMNDGNFDKQLYDDTKNECCASLVLETILPHGLESTSITEVLNLRNTLQKERKAFRRCVSDFVETIAIVEEHERAKKLAVRFAEELSQEKQRTKKILVDIGKQAIQGLLIVGLPTTLTALGTLAVGNNDLTVPCSLGAGIVGVIATVADATRSRRKKWVSSEAAYYLQLSKRMGGMKGVKLSYPRFDYLFNEYIND
jgi:hypothetical protein